jgi:ABC-type nitrate/sulfonate/bicarbonate transport system ATPase subunit
MEEAALLADRIVVFSSLGAIIAELKVSDFFSGERVRRDSQGVAAVRTSIRALWQKSGEESLNA